LVAWAKSPAASTPALEAEDAILPTPRTTANPDDRAMAYESMLAETIAVD
jgi:hypothetical protein